MRHATLPLKNVFPPLEPPYLKVRYVILMCDPVVG